MTTITTDKAILEMGKSIETAFKAEETRVLAKHLYSSQGSTMAEVIRTVDQFATKVIQGFKDSKIFILAKQVESNKARDIKLLTQFDGFLNKQAEKISGLKLLQGMDPDKFEKHLEKLPENQRILVEFALQQPETPVITMNAAAIEGALRSPDVREALERKTTIGKDYIVPTKGLDLNNPEESIFYPL